MHVAQYLGLAHSAEENLIKAFKKLSMQHAFEPDVLEMCEKFALWSTQHLEHIQNLAQEFGMEEDDEPKEVLAAVLATPRMGPFGLLRDLHGLSTLVHEAHMCWVILLQTSRTLRHSEMENICLECGEHLKKETMWLVTKIKNASPQVMVVA